MRCVSGQECWRFLFLKMRPWGNRKCQYMHGARAATVVEGPRLSLWYRCWTMRMTHAGGGVVQYGEQAQVNDDLDGIALRWQNGGLPKFPHRIHSEWFGNDSSMPQQPNMALISTSATSCSGLLAMSNNAASASRCMVRNGTGRLCGP